MKNFHNKQKILFSPAMVFYPDQWRQSGQLLTATIQLLFK